MRLFFGLKTVEPRFGVDQKVAIATQCAAAKAAPAGLG